MAKLRVSFAGHGWIVETGSKESPVIIAGPFGSRSKARTEKRRIEAQTTAEPETETEPLTKVIFRFWQGEVIALFPEVPGDWSRLCSSFVHIGQHSDADFRMIIKGSRPARSEEYESLKAELERAPYHYRLKVCRRVTPAMDQARRAELDRMETAMLLRASEEQIRQAKGD